MRILYLSQYFPPESGATQIRAHEMASNLVRLGHNVTVLTEFPNHPSGIIPIEYKGKLYERELLDGIEVIRFWVKASPKKNFRNRMLFYISFMLMSALFGSYLAKGRYDLVYVTSPPLFVGGAGLFLHFIKKIPLIFEVRDLWPESAVALGEISNKRAIILASKLESACYHHAKKIIVVTQGIFDNLTRRGIPINKLALIPNGANVELFTYSQESRERIRNSLDLGDKFLAIYAGIFGIAQGLETIVETAKIVSDRKNIHFLFIGDGPKKHDIKHLSESYQLNNITILTEKPREVIPAYLSAADVALIPLRRIDLFKGALPSKIFDAWACEIPIILSVDGEARQIMEQAQAGLYTPPEDSQKLSEAIIWMMENESTRKQMGRSGRIFTEQNFSRQVLAEALADLLEKVIQ